jgi:hypothetical protein
MTGKIFCFLIALLCAAQDRRMVTEKIEWTYSDQPANPNPALPSVLLIGDSITRAYYPAVAKGLDGKANCYYFATSASIGDERLPVQIAQYFAQYFAMIHIPFDVVHFNNGMHGWGYSDAEYARYFEELPAAIRAASPHAKLIWASTTPVRKDQPGGATNARIEARNAIAARAIGPSIPIEDQYALMAGHGDLHSDDVHFSAEGSALQAAQVVDSILKLLVISPK